MLASIVRKFPTYTFQFKMIVKQLHFAAVAPLIIACTLSFVACIPNQQPSMSSSAKNESRTLGDRAGAAKNEEGASPRGMQLKYTDDPNVDISVKPDDPRYSAVVNQTNRVLAVHDYGQIEDVEKINWNGNVVAIVGKIEHLGEKVPVVAMYIVESREGEYVWDTFNLSVNREIIESAVGF